MMKMSQQVLRRVGAVAAAAPRLVRASQLVGAFSSSKSALNFFLFAPLARSRHSASHDSRLGEKFVDFKKL